MSFKVQDKTKKPVNILDNKFHQIVYYEISLK